MNAVRGVITIYQAGFGQRVRNLRAIVVRLRISLMQASMTLGNLCRIAARAPCGDAAVKVGPSFLVPFENFAVGAGVSAPAKECLLTNNFHIKGANAFELFE